MTDITNENLLKRLNRYLFGADIFISYSRRDGITYAAGLAYELSKLDFSCVLDQWAGSGADLPRSLETSLKRSTVLVVVATEGAAESEHVAKELEQFVQTKRLIVPISVGRALEKARWSPLIAGLPTTVEAEEALSLGIPSSSVIQRIDKSFKYLKRKRRLRNVFGYTAALVTLLNVVLFLATRYAPDWYRTAPSSPTSVFSSIARAVRSVPAKWWIIAASALTVLIVAQFLKNEIGSISDYIGRRLYSKMLRRSPRGSLRRYQERLLKQSQTISIPFQHGATSDFRDLYVPPRVTDGTQAGSQDAFRAILEFRHLVVLGPPGSGKTTLLNFILRTFAEGRLEELPDKPVPVLLTARRVSHNDPLERSLKTVLGENGFPETDALSIRYLRQGRFMVLFDGLDEVSSTDRPILVSRIRDFIQSYPDCRFIVTSRIAAYRQDFDDLVEKNLMVAEFDDQQIRQFLSAYVVNPPEGKSIEQFMRTLRQNQGARSLARNPLLLTLLSHLYMTTDFSMGRSMSDFYSQSTDVLLRGWTREATLFRPAQKRRVLEAIALYAQDGRNDRNSDGTYITHSKLLETTDSVLSEINIAKDNAQLILDEIVSRTGLLVESDNAGSYRFTHLSFQEFFAAARLRDDPQGLIKRFRADPLVWRETLRLWCGLATDSTKLIESLYHSSPVTAVECLADAHRVDRRLANSIIDEQKRRLGESPQGEGLERAFGAIVSGPRPYGKVMFKFLEESLASSANLDRRLAAARALGFANSKKTALVLANYYNELPQIRPTIVAMGDVAVPVLTNLVRAGSLEALDDLRAIGTPSALERVTALVPLLGQRIESLKRKSSIKIEFENASGVYLDRPTQLRLRVTNSGKESLKDLLIELDDTPNYSVDVTKENRSKRLAELKEAETQIVEYPITIARTGLITLQLKIDGEIYKESALEINGVKDNPYLYGPPVQSTQNFFGRDNELQTSLDNIMSPVGAHTMIVGEQRSGKTSLLYQIRERLAEPYIPVFISFSGVERDEIAALSWLLHRIVDELKKHATIQSINDAPPLEYASDFGKHLEQMICALNADGSQRKLVLLLDEAHLMNRIGEKFQEILREAFLQLVQDLRVVLACYYDFFDDLKVSGSPLHNIFEFIFLRPLKGDDLEMLIVEPASQFGYTYDDDAIELIRTASGGHPYYCQYLCAKSFLEAEKERLKRILRRHVEVATRLVLANDKQKYQLGYWKSMTSEERTFLTKLVANESIHGTSKQILTRLKNKFVIQESNGKYDFTAGLFRDWTKQLIQEDT